MNFQIIWFCADFDVLQIRVKHHFDEAVFDVIFARHFGANAVFGFDQINGFSFDLGFVAGEKIFAEKRVVDRDFCLRVG